jgi:hypothetical protein
VVWQAMQRRKQDASMIVLAIAAAESKEDGDGGVAAAQH